MDLILRLREATHNLHQRIEALPLSRAMAEATISRVAYGRLLGQLMHLHARLEEELPRHLLTALLFQPAMVRLPALSRDMAFWEVPTRMAAFPPVQELLRQMQEWADQSPWALLGVLYVLEGSRMGSMFLARPLAAALGTAATPGQGLDYHIDGMVDRPRTWMGIKSAFSRLELTEAQGAEVVQAAVATMQGLYDLYAWLGEEHTEAGAARHWSKPAVAANLVEVAG